MALVSEDDHEWQERGAQQQQSPQSLTAISLEDPPLEDPAKRNYHKRR